MKNKKIAIIGGGNLGSAIAEGLIKSKFCQPSDICITRRNTSSLKYFADKGCHITSDNKAAIQRSQVIILTVKPYNLNEILKETKAAFNSNRHILISAITGITLQQIKATLNKNIPLFRAMPNTAIAIRESMTCLCNMAASVSDLEYVKSLFNQLGKAIIIDENLMDAATVIGACGIAFAMRYMRANIQGGIEIGFDAETASLIAAQTAKGAAELLLQTKSHPEKEIDKVTTPKGCTIAGLNEMEHQGFSSSMIKGIAASYGKIVK